MDYVEKIREKFEGKIEDIYVHNPRRVYLELKDKSDIRDFVKYIFWELGARFGTASGLDSRTHIEILYHFSFDSIGQFVTLKVKLDRDNPEVDSITPIFKGAEWIEREIWEMLGVNFKGHPNLKRLLLSEDWPEGNYPLRKEEKR